ncbi:MAG: N-6 DNA methylase [Verrucomicrobiales bacterium]|nr:N-6 DNA methylase [Verrucomicrobiales bacterium]
MVLFKDKASHTQIDYLDLIEPQGPSADRLVRPDGVVENQSRPLLFFVNEGKLAEPPDEQQRQIHDLRRALACRGDRAYLAIIRPGTLNVIPVSLKDQTTNWKPFPVNADSPDAITFFSRLAMGTFEEMPMGSEVDYLFKEIFTLVDKAATSLHRLNVKRADVISLVGRVLFFRFLRDRGIIKEENTKKIAPRATSLAHCFDDAENTAATCRWLDKTFNGDFLPLTDNGSSEFFEAKGKATGQKLFHHLKHILKGEEATAGDDYQGRLSFDTPKFDWGHLDFAHIPVGLLSQVYEKLSWKWNRERSQNTSVHYTPRNIAATLVGEAFDNLKDSHAAKVLDPACGASVFLVLAFRRLYRELWKHTKERPGTDAIRGILENQLVGFDICDSALKLSALSLYLTAIELDPDPVPPEKLKFKALCGGRSQILFDWRKEDDKEKGPVVGSIGDHVGKRFDGSFDLILCNPPWTNIGKEYASVSAELHRISKAIVTRLDPEIGKDYKNPDSVPDLPFIWRSMEWCKPDGRMAMALPARTLFKQGPMAESTRKALFRLLEVNGIINCSNLRKTQVWPDMDQPFMLLFARNRRAKLHHRVQFISPHTDLHANSLGEMRIDAKSAQPVDVEQTIAEPWLWKALAVGTALDVEVVRRIKKAAPRTLENYWERELGLTCKNGYQVRPNRKERQDSKEMQVLKDLNSTSLFRFEVNPSELDFFSHNTVGWSRIDYSEGSLDPIKAYRGPLVLIKEAPGSDRTAGWAPICDSDLAFNQSFYGYSANGAQSGKDLVRYLQLFVHSQLWQYYALLTSAKLGFERPNVYKADLDKSPFFPFGNLDKSQREEMASLSSRLLNEDKTIFPDIDAFFGKLYGLSASDAEVIRDTLEVREPNDELGRRASATPTKRERTIYLNRLESYMRPLFKALGKLPEITVWKPSEEDLKSPFIAFTLTAKGVQAAEPSELFKTQVIPLANRTGATQIIEEIEGGLLIAILRHYRYWTPSRARLLGADILRDHMTLFED